MTPERFVELFRLAALQAGSVARYLQDEVRPREKASEGTREGAALTAVDLATQDLILLRLLEDRARVAVDAEEATDLVERFANAPPSAPLIVIDPIDGTYNYTLGSRDYAVMGAMIANGGYQAAVVAFPAHGELYWAIREGGAWRERGTSPAERLAQPPPLGDRVLVSPGVARHARQRLTAAGFDVEVSRCSAVDSSVIALGRGRAAVSESRSDRRRAIGYLMSTECGGAVLHGTRLWRGEDPKILPETCAPSIVAENETVARDLARLVHG